MSRKRPVHSTWPGLFAKRLPVVQVFGKRCFSVAALCQRHPRIEIKYIQKRRSKDRTLIDAVRKYFRGGVVTSGGDP